MLGAEVGIERGSGRLHTHSIRLAQGASALSILWASLCASSAAQTAPSIEQARAAAQATAQSPHNPCQAARPFYWEIGDAHGVLASGQVGEAAPGPQTDMAIASASKWLYGAYVVERRGGQLTEEDIRYLNFRSGRLPFFNCFKARTVGDCDTLLINGHGRIKDSAVGRFAYGGGHMQHHAVLLGLGDLDDNALAAELRKVLHTDLPSGYIQPQPAGGARATPLAYAGFLRKLMTGELKLGSQLGSHAVCTNPKTCAEALRAPIPEDESWHYSLGHWVEDDPQAGDGSYSSPGAFGFYPWISANRQLYGLLAREDRHMSGGKENRPGQVSVMCGRLMRRAWTTGKP